MVRWKQLSVEEAARTWDRALVNFPEHTIFQALDWGRYKKTLGWAPFYWVAVDSLGDVHAMAQALVRIYPLRIAVVSCVGGPVGPTELWNSGFPQVIRESTEGYRLYCRVSSYRPKADADVSRLSSHGWKRPSYPLSSGRSLVLDLTRTDEELFSGFTRNWRRNLKRAQKRHMTVRPWTHPSTTDLVALYYSMESYKGIRTQYSGSQLDAMVRNLDGEILLYRCDDSAGRPLALRACAVQGARAWDLLAATSPEGRRCYASYALLWALIRACRRLDVSTYDLGGVDPIKAKGVYDFKRGTGAADVEYLGEWEWATSAWLRCAGNLAIRFRQEGFL